MRKRFYLPVFIAALLLFSCGNRKDSFTSVALAKDYFPVQVGKYITYRVDSTVFVRSGSQVELHSYQVKHSITGTATDNMGRLTYIVERTLRKADGTGNWTGNGRYYITPLENSVEVIEHNLRVIKLANPMYTGFEWKGNRYLIAPDSVSQASPYSDLYDTEADNDMNKWVFKYTGFGNETIEGQQYTDVCTVLQADNVLNMPPNGSSYGYKAVSSEKYARNIGMVYRDHQIYDFQPPNVDNPQGTYSGFGITMWMIDHN
ncbi:hypothetical protein [Niabella beijingensis]|uniref:hypothetical protein n=1 Tax=Niabella beijingensis TaxID=2872700 RepID=UPI001CBC4E21|nr:hypothetical protein [Niabella beijingensis]MBZ4187901.1 hypothetical protein [Niabella beijingensis]